MDFPELDRRHSRYDPGSAAAVGEVASGVRSNSPASRIKGGIMGKAGSVDLLASDVDPEPLKVEDRVGRVTTGDATFDDEEVGDVEGCAERGDEPEPPPLPGVNDVCRNFGTSFPNSLDPRRDVLEFGVMGESRVLDEALVATELLFGVLVGACLAVETPLSRVEDDLGGMIAVDVLIDNLWGALSAAVFDGGVGAFSSAC